MSEFYNELDNQGISLQEFDGMMEVLFNNGYFCFDDKAKEQAVLWPTNG